MKKMWRFLTVLGFFMPNTASAAEDFFGDLMVSEQMKQEAVSESGQMEAGKILDSRPAVLKIKAKSKKIEKVKDVKPQVIYAPAPFGLSWLAPRKDIEALKVYLTPIELKDTPETYKAINLPKPVDDFKEIDISFGDNNQLWRIIAYGKPVQDDTSAANGIKLYRQYYQMLAKKYGNAQQFYTPAALNVDETDADGNTVNRVVEMPLGAEGFLQKLASGEAVLYSTFENGKIGVTLALYADGNEQTYIVVDYKDLHTGEQKLEDIYDAL